MRNLFKLALLATALAVTSPAHSAVIATLTFDMPTATVASNVPIDINLTLTLDPLSDAIQTDGIGDVTAGLSLAAILAAGGDPMDIVRPLVNVSFECSGTFTSVCGSGPPYDFTFAYPSLIGPANLNLQPGSVTQYLFGTFTPTGGNAPAGTYSFFNAAVNFNWTNAAGAHFSSNIAQTCPQQNPACAFTRTVYAANTAVPEPATWAMMLTGFGLAGAAFRRRRALSLA